MKQIEEEIEIIRTCFNALMAIKKRYLKREINEIQAMLRIAEITDQAHSELMDLGKRGI